MANDARLNIGVSADAKQASATFKELAADIKKVGTESVGVTEGVAKVDAAMAKLAKAPDTVGSLATATAKAKLAVDELRAALEKTPPTAENYQKIADALRQAEEAMDRTIQRAGKLKKAQEDVNKEVEKNASGMKGFAKSMTDVDQIFDNMSQHSNKAVAAFGNLGAAVVGLSVAYKVGKEAGEDLAKAIDAWDAKRAQADARQADANVNTIKFEQALRLAEKGIIGLGRSTADMLKQYDAYVEKMRAARTATEEQTRAAAEYQSTVERVAELTGKLGRQSGFTILSPEEASAQLDSVRALAQGLSDVLAKAFKEGGATERDAWAKANADAIQKVIADFTKFGEEVPPIVQAAYDAMKAGAQGLAEPTVEEIQKIVTAATQMRIAAEAQGKATRDQSTAAQAAETAQRAWTDATHAGITEMNGWVGVSGPAQAVMIQYAAATREAKEELMGFLAAQRALREEQARALEGAQGWISILSNLTESYKSGETSLLNYITQLQDFATQVRQLFGGATGEAKTAVDALTAAVADLIRTAGANGPGDYSPGLGGYLEREIERNKKGR